jgi:beta-lactamase class C
MPYPIAFNLRHTFHRLMTHESGLWMAVAISLCVQVALADEKRVTIPLSLPFQQSSSAASAAAEAPGLHSTQFTQTLVLPAQSSASSSLANPEPIQLPPPVPSATPAPVAIVEAEPELPAKKIPLLTTSPVAAVAYPDGHPEAFVAQFEDYVQKRIAPYVPGVAIAVVAGGEIKSLQTYGVRRAGTREKLTPDTVFRLASVSKPVAATAVAIMVQDGLLTWDSKVTQELPSVKFKTPRYANQITLRHLLSQSVGLPTHTNSSLIEAGMSYAEAVRRLRFANFVCPPGKCYAYQNITYSLAGDMVSAEYGKPFETWVEDKLFQPLDMRSASFGLASYIASPNRATPHVASGKRWIPTNVTANYYRVPSAAGVNASIVDMSHFLLAQLGKYPDVLPIDTLNQIQSRITKNSPAQNHYGTRKGVGNTAYGLGWRMFDYGRYKNFAHHGGWVKGFRSEVVFNRELGIGMVLLTNSETRLARNVIFKFMDLHEIAQQNAQKSGVQAGSFRLSPIANDY